MTLIHRNILSQRCCWYKILAAFCSKWALSNDVRGKNRPGGIDASKEKSSKKEETLENARAISQTFFARPLDEKLFREVFYFVRESLAAPSRIVLESHSTVFSKKPLVIHEYSRQIEIQSYAGNHCS